MCAKEYAFQGNVEFDLVLEMLGERVARRARAVYHWTPEWEFWDPEKNAPRTALVEQDRHGGLHRTRRGD